jgi:hypothetical protein
MKNGFIHILSKKLISFFYYTNLVEWFKIGIGLISKTNDRILKNFAIDLFIVLKWVLVIASWFYGINSLFLSVLIAYLIWTNVFTYFFYHVWELPPKIKKVRLQRRFVNLFIAMAFSNLSYAYLYQTTFKSHFKVAQGFDRKLSFLNYSNFNSLFSDYSIIQPIDNTAYIITFSQLAITFIFVSIILSNTIPDNGST